MFNRYWKAHEDAVQAFKRCLLSRHADLVVFTPARPGRKPSRTPRPRSGPLGHLSISLHLGCNGSVTCSAWKCQRTSAVHGSGGPGRHKRSLHPDSDAEGPVMILSIDKVEHRPLLSHVLAGHGLSGRAGAAASGQECQSLFNAAGAVAKALLDAFNSSPTSRGLGLTALQRATQRFNGA